MSTDDLTQEFDAWLKAVRDADARPGWARDGLQYARGASPSALERELASLEPYLEDVSLNVRDQGTLVVGVGGTPQPVLLSIAAHRPKLLVLVGADDQQGQKYLNNLKDLLDRLQPAPWEELRVVRKDPDDATALYLGLRSALRGAPRPIVIDITGGTKGMSAATFLLSIDLEALDVHAIYLRGDYVTELGVPRPHTTRVSILPNPGLALALHDRRRAESLWAKAEYRAATAVIAGVVARLAALDEPTAELLRAWRRALALARGLEAWSEARYDEVLGNFGAAGVHVPGWIVPLSAAWAGLGATVVARDQALLDSPELHFRWIADAWCWLQRRRDMDPRLVLLRAFALGERAMQGLVAALVQAGRMVAVKDKNGAPWQGAQPGLPKKAREPEGKVAAMLVGEGEGWAPGKKGEHPTWHANGVSLPETKPWLDEGDETWRKLRNAAAHAVGGVDAAELSTYLEHTRLLLRACAASLPGGEVSAAQIDDWTDLGRWPIPELASLLDEAG